MSPTEAWGIPLPKLPALDKKDVRAIRGFFPGKILGRTAALLSLVLLIIGFAGAVDLSLRQFLNVGLSPRWLYYLLLFGLPLLTVTVQIAVEWRAERNRRALQMLAVRVDTQQAGYFRIGPYLNTLDDRSKFSRADKAHEKILEWIERSVEPCLYLTGDSGSGKSSLLNAFVLPTLRERGWVVVETRVWQDAMAALRAALARAADTKRGRESDSQDVRNLLKAVMKRTGARLLIVVDQFEEFIILGKSEQQREFADLLASLNSAPITGIVLLLTLRSDYQTFLEDIGLPPPRHNENFYQVARFTLATASAFMVRSGLDLRPAALDRLLVSAAELDDTPGLVRPITLNVIGHVLASSHIAPSLDAGRLVQHYIKQTVDQPAIRGFVPLILEQLVTSQHTKQPRSEQELAAATGLRHGEVRSALNGLGVAALARPLDPAHGVWELSHDFVARAVARYLGRRPRDLLLHAGAYVAPVLLAMTLLAIAVVSGNNLSFVDLKSQLADLGFTITPRGSGISLKTNYLFDPANFSKATPLLTRLSHLTRIYAFDLRGTQVAHIEPLEDLTSLEALDLNFTKVWSVNALANLTALQTLSLKNTKILSVEPLKNLTALRTLDLDFTNIGSVEPLAHLVALRSLKLINTGVVSVEALKDLAALEILSLSDTQLSSVDALKSLMKLQMLDLGGTKVSSVDPLKELTRLQTLYLNFTQITSVAPLKNLTALRALYLNFTQIESVEALKDLTALQTLDLSHTQITSVEPLKGLTALQSLDLTATGIVSVEPLEALPALRTLSLTATAVQTAALDHFRVYRKDHGLPPVVLFGR